MAVSRMAIANGIGYDNWASQLQSADPWGRAGRARRRRSAGPEGRRQSAPVVLALVGRRVIGAIVADYVKIDPLIAATSSRVSAASRRARCAPTIGSAPRSAGASPACPWGTARASSSPWVRAWGVQPPDYVQLHEGRRRGRGGQRAGSRDGRPPGAPAPDQGLGVQQSEREARGPAGERARAERSHPDRHDHRDPVARKRRLRAMAGRAARAPDPGATRGDGGGSVAKGASASPPPAHATELDAVLVELRDAGVRIGPSTIRDDASLTIPQGEFVAVLGPKAPGSPRSCVRSSASFPSAAGRPRCSGPPPVSATAPSATSLSGTRSMRPRASAVSTSSDLGSTATALVFRSPAAARPGAGSRR